MSLINEIIDGVINIVEKRRKDYIVYDQIDHCFSKNNWTNSDFDSIMGDAEDWLNQMEDERQFRTDRDYVKNGILYVLCLLGEVIADDDGYMDELEDKGDDEDDRQLDDLLSQLDKLRNASGRRSRSRRGSSRRDDYDDRRRGRGGSRRNSRRDRDDDRDGGRYSSRRERRGNRNRRDDRDSRNSRRNGRSKDKEKTAASSTLRAIEARNMVENQVEAVNHNSYEFVDAESKREGRNSRRGRTEAPVRERKPEPVVEVSTDDLTQEDIINNYPIDSYPYMDKIAVPAYDPKVSVLVWYITADDTRKCKLEPLEMDPNDHIFTYVGQSGKTTKPLIEKEQAEVSSIILNEVASNVRTIQRTRDNATKEFETATKEYEAKMADDSISEADKANLVKPVDATDFTIGEGSVYDVQSSPVAGFGTGHLYRNMIKSKFFSEDKITNPTVGYFQTNELDVIEITKNDADRELIIRQGHALVPSDTRTTNFENIRRAMTNMRPNMTPGGFMKLDRYLTKVINDVLSCSLSLDCNIDSYYDDILDLAKNLKEAFGEATIDALERNSARVFNRLRCILQDNSKLGEACEFNNRALVSNLVTPSVMIDKSIGALNVCCDSNKFYVDENSHPTLFTIISRMENEFNTTLKNGTMSYRVFFNDGLELEVFINFWSPDSYVCVIK